MASTGRKWGEINVCSDSFLLLIQSRTQAQEVVPPALRMGLPTSIIVSIICHWYAWRVVS